MSLKVASWNIAGGRRINSLKNFDYTEEDLPYFLDIIDRLNPDIICIQESHYYKKGRYGIGTRISDSLGYDLAVESVNSPSHIDVNAYLGNVIISKIRVINVDEVKFPDPSVKLYWPNGTLADTHKKNIQLASFDNFHIANCQMLPIKIFGYTYDDSEVGIKLSKGIDAVASTILKTPLIWCGDFNFDNPSKIYSVINKLNLRDALPDVKTRPSLDGKKKKPDHIFYSPEFKLLESEVIVTDTDHYLCYAEFEF